MSYRPVGWGSHHWDMTGADGERWFVTVDELAHKRLTDAESLDAGSRACPRRCGPPPSCGRRVRTTWWRADRDHRWRWRR
jgi:hypothetical protein